MARALQPVIRARAEYYRDGHSSKHVADIRAIRAITGRDEAVLNPWRQRLGLRETWLEIAAAE